jgi:hypothetical protein
MIVGDAPLEAALRKKRVHVNEIRNVVMQQLTMVEARQGPMNAAMLAGGMMHLGRAPVIPRPEVRAVTAPASTPGVRVMSLTEVAVGPVVLYSPIPGISQDIGTVSYTPPLRPTAGQNAGGAAAAVTSAGASFTGVRVRPLIRTPGTKRGPPLSREAAASISQVIVTLTLLLANAGSTNGFMAYSCEDMRSPMIGYELTPQAGCWMKQPTHATPSRVDAGRGPVSSRPLQDDGNGDASGLRLKRRIGTLEDDHDREAGPDQSPGLLGNIELQKGNPV